MSSYVSVTLRDLIEETLDLLHQEAERPLPVTVGSTALGTTTATQLTLTSASDWDAVNVNDILENGQELLLVTGKSSDATPVFTVSRGYSGTTAATAATGAVLLHNPQWPRERVKRAVTRALRTAISTYLPSVKSEVFRKVAGTNYVQIPADAIDVVAVAYVRSGVANSYVPVQNWHFENHVPTTGVTGVTSRKLLRVGPIATDTTDLLVSYRRPYRWTTGDLNPASENDTVEIYFGSENLPALWAAAFLLSGREFSRLQVDKIEEWNQEASIRAGVNLRMVKEAWGQFYRGVDEARRLVPMPRHRPYRKLQRH